MFIAIEKVRIGQGLDTYRTHWLRSSTYSSHLHGGHRDGVLAVRLFFWWAA
jgi:hypothetical protein